MSVNLAAALFIGIISTTFNPPTTFPSLSPRDAGSEIAAYSTHTPASGIGVSSLVKAISPLPENNGRAVVPQANFGVFNSVAISAAKLPAAAKWHTARQADNTAFFTSSCDDAGFSQCNSRFASRVRGVVEQASGLGERDMLNLVNRTVNAAMTYRDDSRIWGKSDYWATPAEMAAKGFGDCEDYAIAKYWLLRSLGVADGQLQLVILQDTRRRLFHAVLVAHLPSGSYVLDNVSNRLLADSAYSQYQPIMSFAGGKNFIHGFASGTRSVAAMPKDLSAVAPGVGM